MNNARLLPFARPSARLRSAVLSALWVWAACAEGAVTGSQGADGSALAFDPSAAAEDVEASRDNLPTVRSGNAGAAPASGGTQGAVAADEPGTPAGSSAADAATPDAADREEATDSTGADDSGSPLLDAAVAPGVEDPGLTEEPAPAEAAPPSEEPSPSEPPSPVEQPPPVEEPSEDPLPAEEPEPVEEPAPVEEPEPSEEPAPVEEPEPSEEPAPAEEPAPGEDPTEEPTEPPVPTCEASPSYPLADDCAACICNRCSLLVAGCYDSDNAARDAQCAQIHSCAQASDCTGDACYCGDFNPLCVAPSGPCVQVIQSSLGASHPGHFFLARSNPNHPLARANQLELCSARACRAECGL